VGAELNYIGATRVEVDAPELPAGSRIQPRPSALGASTRRQPVHVGRQLHEARESLTNTPVPANQTTHETPAISPACLSRLRATSVAWAQVMTSTRGRASRPCPMGFRGSARAMDRSGPSW